MTVGELSTKTGVPATTLRYYDAIGLVVAERRPSGHRAYPDGAVEVIEVIGLCRAAGFSLDEVSAMLTASDATERRRLAAAKVEDIDASLARLAEARAVVAHFARCTHGATDRAACARAVRDARARLARSSTAAVRQRRT